MCYAQRHYLFGPKGVAGLDTVTSSDSLYALVPTELGFDLLYHAGILVAFLWLLGVRTLWTTPLNLILYESLNRVAPDLVDGGDNLARLLLFFSCFADLSSHLHVTAPTRATRPLHRRGRLAKLANLWRPARAAMHNAAVLCMALQICVVYTVAGLTKVQGETWQNGTALYHAWRAREFFQPGLSEALYSSASLLTLASYLTVAFQVAFPLLVFLNRHTRRAAILLGVGFHVGIGTLMGLQTFALFMIAADLALVTDTEMRSIATLWQHLNRSATAVVQRLRSGIRRASPASN